MTASLFLLAVLLSALFSGLETGLYSTSRLRIQLDASSGIRPAVRARALLKDMPTLLTVLLVSNNTANWAASLLAQVLLLEYGVRDPEAVGTFGVSVVLFVLAESVPKQAFHRGRERLLYPVVPILAAAHAALRWPTWPLTRFAQWFSQVIGSGSGSSRPGTGPREALILAGRREGFLTPFQERVAHSVLGMRTRTAANEAREVSAFISTCLGSPGVTVPPGSRDPRVLVLDSSGRQPLGWVILATLWTPSGFRQVSPREIQPVLQVSEASRLDEVYLQLDRMETPFAWVRRANGELGVLDANHLRGRVMGTTSESPT